MEKTSIGKGYVQVYTGDGKGKTTAALGLAVRAAASGLAVFFGQFMKGVGYSELALEDMTDGRVVIRQFGTPRFICKGEPLSEEDLSAAHRGLDEVRRALLSGSYQVVVADEICVAHHFGLLSLDELMGIVSDRPEGVELICTGRGAPDELVEAADLVTEMREVKHYYRQGVQAREGIES